MKGLSSQYLQSTPLPSIDHWESDIMTMYNGSDRKEGLIAPDGIRYLIKYPEEHTRMNDMDTSYVNNILSEYISSHVLNIAGFPTHETFIGVRNQEPVVACKNFVDEQDTLSEFGHYMRKHYNSCEIGPVPDIRQIQYILNNDPVLRPQSEHFWNIYWERFIGDALVGNFDRHMGNWGYVVHRQTRSVTEAPIYDNGSTLYPALSEKAMEQDILSSPKEIARRILLFPKAALTVNGRKVSYLDMLSSCCEPVLSDAVCRIVPKIQAVMPEIHDFIQNISFLSDIRKNFYNTMVNARMNLILAPACKRCLGRDYEQTAYERLATGEDYNEQLFERHWNIHREELEQKIREAMPLRIT